ncbi:MAG: alpha/beta hydrolase [Oscillospiraceae bacterium]|jgi:alpha/beta hydrolase family protein|nr:alpha/beta hydrolase [Oscillospiraceae bacterium]
MTITGGYVMVDGIKTYYETNNGPHNPKGTIVCLHTAGRESRQYHGMMEIFADKYNMVAFDMPAHGKTWPLPGNVGIGDYKEYGKFVWDFIQVMNIEDPIIIGCSVGGNMVYHVAETYPVKAMVSMQGSPKIKAMGTAYGTTVDLLDNPYVSCQHSHWDFSESLCGKKCPPEAHDFIMWGVCQECGRAKKADLSIYNNYDVTSELGQITCPCLLIRGEDDWNVPEHYYHTAIEGMTNAKKVVFEKVPGYGHFIIVEAPEVVCELIDNFLQDT